MGVSGKANGPLEGLRVVEFECIGPGPFAAMMLADMSADVVRVERSGTAKPKSTFTTRGRRAVRLDLKDGTDREAALSLIARADVLIEGLRPGVMERLGLGPEQAFAVRPSLIYARMTGWGQTGPLAPRAGHDINYIAISGALGSIRHAGERPAVPLNIIGDLGGGAMFLVVGILAALRHAASTGVGQVVDGSVTDGVNLFMGLFHELKAAGRWSRAPGENLIDGGAHFYNTYACADGRYIAVGPIEPQFYAILRDRLGLADEDFDAQQDMERWPALKQRLAHVFSTKTRDEWTAIFEGTDACFSPVLELGEAPHDAHNRARQSYQQIDGSWQPAPAPRFSETPTRIRPMPSSFDEIDAILRSWKSA